MMFCFLTKDRVKPIFLLMWLDRHSAFSTNLSIFSSKCLNFSSPSFNAPDLSLSDNLYLITAISQPVNIPTETQIISIQGQDNINGHTFTNNTTPKTNKKASKTSTRTSKYKSKNKPMIKPISPFPIYKQHSVRQISLPHSGNKQNRPKLYQKHGPFAI